MPSRFASVVFSLCLLSLGSSYGYLAAGEAIIPRFLTGRLAADQPHPPERWSATENVAWKTDIPGLAWSSPIVVGDRVFLTTCINAEASREPRKGLYLEDLDANKYPPETSEHFWKVLCLDLNDGRILWERLAHQGVPAKPHHIKNTLASETPTTDGQHLYALFGNVGLFCYDLDGTLVWEHLLAPRETHYGWGTSMSPVVHDDRVYLANDNQERSTLTAFDKITGEIIWEVEREENTNYSTPFIWENERRTEIVVSGIEWCTSYDLDGRELWRIKGKSILAIPTPFDHRGMLYVTSGHVVWGENRTYVVRPGAAGDISPLDDQPNNEHLVWHAKVGPYHPTPLIVDDQLYMLLDRGFMASYDALTGATVYEKKRIPNGRAFTSSPWSYAGKLFCLNEDGVTFAIALGPEFKVLYTNELAEDDMAMATPVIVGDKLLLRTAPRLYCIGPAQRSLRPTR